MLRMMATNVANACWAMLMYCAGMDAQTSNTVIAVATGSNQPDGMVNVADDPAGNAAAALQFYGGN